MKAAIPVISLINAILAALLLHDVSATLGWIVATICSAQRWAEDNS